MKKTMCLMIFLLFGTNVFAQKKETSNIAIDALALSGCSLKLDTDFNFGVINFTEETKAVKFPLNFAPHAELPMNIKVQCSPGTAYNISYATEERLSPLMDGVNYKKIVGIILNGQNGNNEDFLLSYIYNLDPKYSAMLHSKNINEIGNGELRNFELLVGLQNPLQRGYRYPSAGTYYGESILTMVF